MEEKFIENGEYTALPGNEQTLRNFVHHLEKTGQIGQGEEHRRIYDHVFGTPPGEQMLIDFGEVTLSKKTPIHFMIDEAKIAEFREMMGYYQIVSSELEMDALDIIDKYHGLTRIEDQFREMKGTLETRPVFVNTPEHI